MFGTNRLELLSEGREARVSTEDRYRVVSIPSGRVVASVLPAGRAATTVARGAPSPEGIHAAHSAVIEWCEANGHTRTGLRWEVYDHWREDQDPAAFETAVYWLLTP